MMVRCVRIAAIIASASLAVSCAPPMTTYLYPKYGFTVAFPSPPKIEDTTILNSAPTAELDSQSLGREFTVSITEVSARADIDALAESAAQDTAKMVGGEVSYRSSCATAEGVLGRELVISRGGRRAVRARYYRSGTRFYTLAFTSKLDISPDAERTGKDPSAETGSDNDPAAQAFLGSFHLMPAANS